jgi:hypothetical protein
MKNLSQDIRSSCRDLNPGPPEYEVGVLTTRLRRSVTCAVHRFLIVNYLFYLLKTSRVVNCGEITISEKFQVKVINLNVIYILCHTRIRFTMSRSKKSI